MSDARRYAGSKVKVKVTQGKSTVSPPRDLFFFYCVPYAPYLKKVEHFRFEDNFVRRGPIFVFFLHCLLLLFIMYSLFQSKLELRHPFSPQICLSVCLEKSKYSTLQLYSIQLFQIKVMQRCSITINVYEGCLFLVYLYWLITCAP